MRARRRQMPLWQELPLLLVVAFCLAVLIRTFLLQVFFIPSSSMEDTLLRGDRVLVNKVVYDVRDPKRGEVVVFHGTAAWAPESTSKPEPGFVAKVGNTLADLVGVSEPGEKDFIKRVIGLPGDTVMCCDDEGRVIVNGVPLDEPYVLRDSPTEVPPTVRECRSRWFAEVVVPPGHLFVMGDHRLVSQDSRCQGTVPIDNVIGRAFVIVWPKARWASLSAPETFDDLPKPTAAPAVTAREPVAPDPAPGIAVILPLLASLLVPASPVSARLSRPSRLPHRRLLT
ncbi:MAG TPA: signal peptidase I [Micromonosporaceae bacterium]|nr:signal peptidase I [Micromonosporaceae bacterium]